MNKLKQQNIKHVITFQHQWHKDHSKPNTEKKNEAFAASIGYIFCCCFSVREEVCGSRGGSGAGNPVQTVQGEQRLRPLKANRRPPQQKGEQPEQEQPLCTGDQLPQCYSTQMQWLWSICWWALCQSINKRLLFFTDRRHSSGCSLTSLSSETWWLCSTKSIKRYHTGIINRHKKSAEQRN